MSTTVSSQIIEVLNDICAKFGIATDWSQENMMPYLQELAGKYIQWETATSVAWLVFAIVVLCGLASLFIWLDCKLFGDGFLSVISVFLIILATIMIITQIADILTCKYFPEKMIITYLQGILKNVR